MTCKTDLSRKKLTIRIGDSQVRVFETFSEPEKESEFVSKTQDQFKNLL